MGKESRLAKLLSTIAFSSLSVAFIGVGGTPSSSGYELSIYDAFPPQVWILLIVSVSAGVLILVHEAFRRTGTRWWLAGLVILILSNSAILLLPAFRGYAIYGRGDTLTHLGLIRDILVSGHTGPSNFYPVEHVLGATMIYAAKFDISQIPFVFFPLFETAYILGIYSLARSLSRRRTQVLVMTAFAAPLAYSFFHANIHPAVFSVFMVPFFLCAYFKRVHATESRSGLTILLLLLAFSITLFHPITAIYLAMILLVVAAARRLCRGFVSFNAADGTSRFGLDSMRLSLIVLTSFFSWYLSFSYIQRSFKAVFDWLLLQAGTPLIDVILDPLATAGLSPLQTAELFLSRYGAIAVMILISLAIALLTVSDVVRKRTHVMPEQVAFALLFLLSLLFGVILLFGDFVEYEINPVRLARFAIFAGTVLVSISALSLSHRTAKPSRSAWSSPRVQPALRAALVVTLLVLVPLALGNVYGSSRVYEPNSQVTGMEIEATAWFGTAKDPRVTVAMNLPELLKRFENYNFGVGTSTVRESPVVRLDSHFGYDRYERMSDGLHGNRTYIVLLAIDRQAPQLFPENVRKLVHQYSDSDVARLDSDFSVSSIYTNGEVRIWYVGP